MPCAARLDFSDMGSHLLIGTGMLFRVYSIGVSCMRIAVE
jgi:hypothetical protein